MEEDVLELVAVNDMMEPENTAYLQRHDTACGNLPVRVELDGDNLRMDGYLVRIMSWYDNEWSYTRQMIWAALPV